MRYSFSLSTLLVFLLMTFLNSTSHANSLSEKIIRQWMASQQSLETWGEQHEAQLAKYEAETSPASPSDLNAESMIAPLKAAGLYEEANKLVNQHGFKSVDEWANITLRITKAAAALEFKKHPSLQDTSELEALIQNPQISPEHKAMLTDALSKNKQMVDQILNGANEQDMNAVEPLLGDILQLMDSPM